MVVFGYFGVRRNWQTDTDLMCNGVLGGGGNKNKADSVGGVLVRVEEK